MMVAGLCFGMDLAGPRPVLLRPDASEIDRGGAVHPRCLGGVRVELIARDHLDPVKLPVAPFVLVPVAHLDRPALLRQWAFLTWFPSSGKKGLNSTASRYILSPI